MLDFIYYPVSAVLWLWHTVFASVLGPASGPAWVLSVIFLVLTLRAALFLPFLKQARMQAVLKQLQPKVAAVKKKYADDRTRQATEIQQIYKDNGVKTFATMIPIVGQVLVFIGLFHVLRSFDRTGSLAHLPFLATTTPMSPDQNAATPNYVFSAADVQSFMRADLFGAPLSTTMASAGDLLTSVAAIAIPLVLIAAVATHFTARASMSRQDDTTRLPLMRALSLWVFPAGALVGGALMPVAILFYFVANNASTFVQQYAVHRRLDTEAAAQAQRNAKTRQASAPKPGAKPNRVRR